MLKGRRVNAGTSFLRVFCSGSFFTGLTDVDGLLSAMNFEEYDDETDEELLIYAITELRQRFHSVSRHIYSSINTMLNNKKYLDYGKNAKEFVHKFQWSKIIEDYKKILN